MEIVRFDSVEMYEYVFVVVSLRNKVKIFVFVKLFYCVSWFIRYK